MKRGLAGEPIWLAVAVGAWLIRRARKSLDAGLARAGDDVSHTRARLLALSPGATLRRGYAIAQRGDATVVRAAAEVSPGERLTVRFAEDQLTVSVDRE